MRTKKKAPEDAETSEAIKDLKDPGSKRETISANADCLSLSDLARPETQSVEFRYLPKNTCLVQAEWITSIRQFHREDRKNKTLFPTEDYMAFRAAALLSRLAKMKQSSISPKGIADCLGTTYHTFRRCRAQVDRWAITTGRQWRLPMEMVSLERGQVMQFHPRTVADPPYWFAMPERAVFDLRLSHREFYFLGDLYLRAEEHRIGRKRDDPRRKIIPINGIVTLTRTTLGRRANVYRQLAELGYLDRLGRSWRRMRLIPE